MPPALLPLRALLDPSSAVAPAVELRKWLIPLVLLMVATAASGVATAVRLDATRVVIPRMEQSGELGKASEREIDEAVQQAQRVAIVGAVAKGIFLTPLSLLAVAVALKLSAWLIGRKAPFGALFTVAALAMMPIVVYHLIVTASALSQGALSPKMIETLVPTSLAFFMPDSSPKLGRLLRAVDLFNLWAAGLLGLGFATAAQLKPWKGLLFGVFLYALFAAAVMIGGPGLAGGMGGPGGPGGGH